MYQPIVQLKSGGYLVINPTEALVSIDINSGRSTREHNIEQTAYNTNVEATAEIARQLRLRDMAGLVVIDFIDMEQSSHVRKVEKAMKDAVKNDRARIQVGRISSFGLMEMSRQRLRTGVLEASTKACPHCEGTGLMRTAASAGLAALRIIEDEAARGRGEKMVLRAGREAAVYVLNKKRSELADIESRYGVSIEIAIDETFEGAQMTVESSGARPIRASAPRRRAELVEEDEDSDEAEIDDEDGRATRKRRKSRSATRRARVRARRRRAAAPPPPPRWTWPPQARRRKVTPSPASVRRRGRDGSSEPPKRPRRSRRSRQPKRRPRPAQAARPQGRRASEKAAESQPDSRRWSSGRSTRSRRSPKPIAERAQPKPPGGARRPSREAAAGRSPRAEQRPKSRAPSEAAS